MSAILVDPMEAAPPPPPPPAMVFTSQQTYTSVNPDHGSFGPVIGVLVVITVIGVLSCIIGRLCSGRPVLGHGGHFDLEGWLQRKCFSHIDGGVDPPPAQPASVPPERFEEALQDEIKEEEQEPVPQQEVERKRGKKQVNAPKPKPNEISTRQV